MSTATPAMPTHTAPEFLPLMDRTSAHALCRTLLARAEHQGLALRPPPAEPTTCCGRGCNGCVWEGYYDAIAYWRGEALATLASATT